jgi:hypothetical protein
MKSYVAELQLRAGDATELAAAGERARTAAEQLTFAGRLVYTAHLTGRSMIAQ